MIEILARPDDLIPDCLINAVAGRVRSVGELVERTEGVSFGSVTIALVDLARICDLHDEYFDDPSPTDVITFPGLGIEPAGDLDGDIVICVEIAREQASEGGNGVVDEIVFLAAHGLLHLAGWDDAAPADRARMLDRQRELMRMAGQEIE